MEVHQIRYAEVGEAEFAEAYLADKLGVELGSCEDPLEVFEVDTGAVLDICLTDDHDVTMADVLGMIDNASEEEMKSVFERLARERFGELFVKGLSWNQLSLWEEFRMEETE